MNLSDIEKNDPLNRSAAHLLHKAEQFATEVFADKVGTDGLTPRQFAVLSVVERHQGLSQTDLVDVTGVDRSTLADIVRRMLKKGLLSRRRTLEDQRAYAIKLSPEGQAVLDNHAPRAREADELILAAVPVELREAFILALKAIVSSTDDDPVTSDSDDHDASGSHNGGSRPVQQIRHPEPGRQTGPQRRFANIRA
jgi:MarR family transcriptional regulator, temperature-dependent positive regulator of motility